MPVVVQNEWGWRDMIQHEKTGLLCDTDEDGIFWAERLARDEQFRMGIVSAARFRLETELANPEQIWEEGWKPMLEGLA